MKTTPAGVLVSLQSLAERSFEGGCWDVDKARLMMNGFGLHFQVLYLTEPNSSLHRILSHAKSYIVQRIWNENLMKFMDGAILVIFLTCFPKSTALFINPIPPARSNFPKYIILTFIIPSFLQ